MNNWIREARRKLKKEYGNKCKFCEATTQLEFAHKEPTQLYSIGRGRKERYYDVLYNPQSYILLCKECHKKYDKERKSKCP